MKNRVDMDDAIKSPLNNGKPAWNTRYMRVFGVYIVGCILAIVGQFVLWVLFNQSAMLIVGYSLGILVWVFGYPFFFVRWIHGQGLSFWKLSACLESIDGVPCPNCLYPLCQVEGADRDCVCSECGRGINGVEAMRAWDNVRGYHRPQSWEKWLNED